MVTRTTRPRTPRDRPTFNSLTQGEDEPAGGMAGAASPPDFVGSKYQRTKDGGPAGFFLGDWVVWVSRTRAELLVLLQLAYWFGESDKGTVRAKKFRAGFYWVYKTYAALGEEMHLTKEQVRGAVRSLARRGLVISLGGLESGELPHYRLNPAAIDREVEKAQRKLGAVGGGCSRQSNQKGGRRAGLA